MSRPFRCLIITTIFMYFAFGAKVCVAQVATGTPPFGSFGGGPDVVNLGNLNVHVTIPVRHKAGRGTDFQYDIGFDSAVWTPITSSGVTTWGPANDWGITAVNPSTLGYTSHKSLSMHCRFFQETQWITEYYTLLYDWIYWDAFGTAHPMDGEVQNGGAPDCGPSNTALLLTTDGSGYKLSIPDATLYTTAGAVGVLSGGTFTDRNGNQITQSGGTFTDTLGQTALSVTGSGTVGNPYLLKYTAPNNGTAQFTMNYTNYTIATNFGVSGVNEYKSSAAVPLVTSIVLPDGSQYTFTYEPTPGSCTPYSGTSCTTARIASITQPTGGQISYTWYGFTACTTGNTGMFSDGSDSCLQRTTPDGTWTYTRNQVSGAHWQTKQTTPDSNDTVIDFQKDSATSSNGIVYDNFYETQRVAYQGSSSSGSVLETLVTCYNGNTSSCTTTAVNSPITQRTVTTTLPGNLQSKNVQSFNSFGMLTESDDYDYGSGSPGGALRMVSISYQSFPNNTNMNAFQQQVQVKNGAGTVISQTTNNYDEGNVTGTSGTPQHTSVSGSRGNLTSIDYPAGSLVSHNTYYDTGTVNTATDVNGSVTTYSYSGSSCGNAFPTSVSEPLSLSRSMTWNCTGGVQTSLTDENGKTVNTAYTTDAYFWRPNAITDQLGNQTTFYYQPSTQYCCPWEVASNLTFNNGNSQVTHYQYMDGLGRTFVNQQYDFARGGLDSVSYTFDANGRLYTASMPCVAGWANGCPTGTPLTTYHYDALSRPTLVVDGGGGTVTYTYSQTDVLVSVNAPSGENAKRRQLEYDALGRLTSVCEVTNATGSGTCGQNNAQTGFWTKYTYDALNNLLTVTQNAQSSTTQTRTSTYDAMSRLMSETNAENGTTTYTYDVIPSGCWAAGTAQPGDLTRTQDAAGNSLCRTYDALHRVTGIGPSSIPPCKRFSYDKTSNGVAPVPSGATINNALGRLVEAETDNCGNWPPIPITDEWFSYTARGETSDVYASTPHSGGYYHSALTYWANGAPNLLTGPAGYYAAYNVDSEGRIYSTSPSGGALSSTTYNTANQPTNVTFASGDSNSFTYDPNTGRMTQYQFAVGSSPQYVVGSLTWNANGTLQTQNISDAFNSANTQNCSYSYDDLARLGSANCGSAAAQTFSYDSFGNISKSGSPYSFQPTYSSSTNRMSTVGSCTPTYDGDGNVTNDCIHTYTWDNYGRPITIDSVSLTYDAFGRMAEQNRSGAYTQFVYSPTGFEIQIMNGQASIKSIVALPAGNAVVYTAAGQFNYYSDHLGSFRFASTTSRTMYFDLAYAPFGETYATSGSTDPAFTGQRQDTVSGLYDFPAREYSIQGRWPSPDPAGLAAVDPTNPQSWNRYAYVMNNPLMYVDPLGMNDCAHTSGDCGTIVLDGTPINVSGWFGRGLWSFFETSGSVAPCPNNDCFGLTARQGPNGTTLWQQPWLQESIAIDGVQQSSTTFWAVGTVSNGSFSFSFWDFLTNPWSGSVIFPLVSFGPAASAGVGPTVAYNPRTDTGCIGLAAGAMVPAGGRAAAIGPLTVGNLDNADQILAGGSVFAGAQSPNPFVGVQGMGNSSGLLAGPTLGSPGVIAGPSVSKCQAGAGKKLLNWLINNIIL